MFFTVLFIFVGLVLFSFVFIFFLYLLKFPVFCSLVILYPLTRVIAGLVCDHGLDLLFFVDEGDLERERNNSSSNNDNHGGRFFPLRK